MDLRKIERITTSLAIVDVIFIISGLLAMTIDDVLGLNVFSSNLRKNIPPFFLTSFLFLLGLSLVLNFSILTRYVREFVQFYLEKNNDK